MAKTPTSARLIRALRRRSRRHLSSATDRALCEISGLQAMRLIDSEMAQRARDVVGLLFESGTIYASIAPDDGGVCFYWVAADWAITIDLYPEGGGWYCARNGESRRVQSNGGIPRWMWDELTGFSAYVQAANPEWRLQAT